MLQDSVAVWPRSRWRCRRDRAYPQATRHQQSRMQEGGDLLQYPERLISNNFLILNF